MFLKLFQYGETSQKFQIILTSNSLLYIISSKDSDNINVVIWVKTHIFAPSPYS